MDSKFDALIQSVIRSSAFSGATILCIAHRLNTIIDSDRILVLDKGEAIEYDHPGKLVREPSAFRDLLLDTGAESSSHLIKSATSISILDDQVRKHQRQKEEDSPYYDVVETDFDVFKVDLF